MKGAGQESTCWADPPRPRQATTVTASTIPPLRDPRGNAAATNTPVGRTTLPNCLGHAIVPNSLGGLATPSKAPPPPVGRSTMRRLQALGATSPVRQEEVITWFG